MDIDMDTDEERSNLVKTKTTETESTTFKFKLSIGFGRQCKTFLKACLHRLWGSSIMLASTVMKIIVVVIGVEFVITVISLFGAECFFSWQCFLMKIN
jgi:hypothetical protein